ncbi:MAG: HIT family protein [Phycisphaerales bacterium]|jgi:histidine triad (HIT) family protein
MPTVFARIIRGELPCHKVYENELVLAFLDVSPLSNGHTLVIPKQIASSLHELSEESASALGVALVRVSKAVLQATGATSYNILQNNGEIAHQAVFHVHFHIIPTYTAEDGLVLDWVTQELTDGALLAKEIQEAL